MQAVRAKKSLGQHFLTDLTIARRIADTLSLADVSCTPQFDMCGKPVPVLEIGPGMGVLTQYLLKNPDIRLTAIEIDRESVAYLREWYPELNLVEGDFLKYDLDALFPNQSFCVIGNYPYNISSQIFFKVLEHRDRIPVCSGMIQKEVAQRLAANPGKKDYGILSVLLQAYYDIEYLFTVGNHVFNPPPKVESAVIRLKRNKRQHLDCDEQLFKTVVKTAFNQRRKQMRNSLQQLVGKGNPLLQENIFTKRPEQLHVDEFVELTKMIEHGRTQNIL
jgi:16S rRNA (adenine1518-N6/adenine1519-N6)-dimethyltransferase